MITVAIVTRRLKEEKTYEDFRKAWYHTLGFGAASRLCTMINALDPREITAIGFVDTNLHEFQTIAEIDVAQRLENPLDDVIEPQIGRKFGIMVSEDDFSENGSIDYKPAAIAGKAIDLEELANQLKVVAGIVREASRQRDNAKSARDGSDSQ